MEFVPWTSFGRIFDRYSGNACVHRMTCAEHFRGSRGEGALATSK
jgi:hypothetical protein